MSSLRLALYGLCACRDRDFISQSLPGCNDESDKGVTCEVREMLAVDLRVAICSSDKWLSHWVWGMPPSD